MKYFCIRCGQHSDSKRDLKRHLTRKKICTVVNINISVEEYLKILELKKIDYLIKINDFYSETMNNINNNKNVINNNNTINIHLNDYINTNYDFILDIIDKCKNKDELLDIPNFIREIHFSKDRPENHNIFITDRRNNTVSIIENGILVEYGKGAAIVNQIMNETLNNISKTEDKILNDEVYLYENAYKSDETKEHDENIVAKTLHVIRNGVN